MRNCIILLITLLLFAFTGCDRENNITDDPQANLARGIFTLTDAPRDELSVLQVDLTELKIADLEGLETLIFSQQEGDEPFTLNLLNLQDLNALLGSVPLAPGNYKTLFLSYENALALDLDGNSLTVKEQRYGTAKALLNPYLTVTEDNLYIEIDFDLNNSVYNIVAGPHGSLLLMPTLVIKVGPPDEDPDLDEFKGVVQSVEAMSMVITFNDESINIVLTEETVVEVDNLITTPAAPGFDLMTLIYPGCTVEIKGTLDVDTNTVTATKIERKFENHGLESQGLVVGLGDLTFNLLVLDARDSGFAVGSIQTITYDTSTFFVYTKLCEPATPEQLALGQEVRVTGMSDNPAAAQKVKLRETKIIGTVVSGNQTLNQITVNVAKIEGMAVENIPGFNNPMTAEFEYEFPTTGKVDDEIELEGLFNLRTMDVFTVLEYKLDDDDDDDEDGDRQTWVGKQFSVISTAPLQIRLTRGGGNGNIESRTATVIGNSVTSIIEKNKSTSTAISAAELVAGINSGKYSQMKAKGIYNKTEKNLTAELVLMTVDKK
jgi:hypothetical protein